MAYKQRLRNLPVDIDPKNDLAVLDSGRLFLSHPLVRRFLLFWTSGYTATLPAFQRRRRRRCDDPANHVGGQQDLGVVTQLESLVRTIYWKWRNIHICHYPYQTLPDRHIRLLRIVPGEEGSELETHLFTVQLAKSNAFETLSYTWGGTQARFTHCGEYCLPVTANLYQALLALRSETEARVFWVDAICINQKDTTEKTAQIKMMREIYATSERTVVWLGTMTCLPPHANDLMDSLIQLGQDPKAMPKPELERERTGWASLFELFTDPWFSRMWIIQEVAVSRDVVVSIQKQSWPWKDFILAAQIAQVRAPCFQTIFEPDNLIRLANIRRAYMEGQFSDLLQVLSHTRCSASTEDKDKINAALGLTRVKFEPDVTGTADDMFVRFAAHVVRASANKMLLLNLVCDCVYSLKPKLPSWVPDWEVRHGPRPFASWPIFHKWKAGGDLEPVLSLSADDRTLQVRGFILDHVQYLGLTYREQIPPTNMERTSKGEYRISRNAIRMILQSLRRSQQWYDIAINYGTMYQGKEARYHAHLLTLVAASGPETADDTKMPELTQGYRTWHSMATRGLEVDRRAVEAWANKVGEKAIRAGMRYIDSNKRYAWGRRFFASKDLGIIGLCPSLTRRGDVIAVLHGGKTPYVLRHVQEGKYKLIGECYAHGFMHGEALSRPEAANLVNFELI